MMKTMKIFLLSALFFSILFPFSARAQDNAAQGVNSAFAEYNQALIQKNGPLAASYLSKATLESYEKNRQLALKGSKEEIKKELLANQVQILLFRHRIPVNLLKSFSEKEIFAYTVNEGWTPKEALEIQSLHHIEIHDNTATAQLFFKNQDLGAKLQFQKEAATWKVNLTSLDEFISNGLKYGKKFRPLASDEKYLLEVVEKGSGKKIGKKLWDLPSV